MKTSILSLVLLSNIALLLPPVVSAAPKKNPAREAAAKPANASVPASETEDADEAPDEAEKTDEATDEVSEKKPAATNAADKPEVNTTQPKENAKSEDASVDKKNQPTENTPATPVVPIALPAPSEESDETPTKHYLRGGLLATNTYYLDPTINPGLYSGFFRPFAKYTLNEKWEFNARALMTVKHYATPLANIKQTNVIGNMEILSAETKLGGHQISVGRNFYSIEQGLLFANFADGVSYNNRFAYGQVRGFAAFSGDYGASACALNITGCNGDPSPFVNTPNLAPDSGIQSSGKRLFFAAEYFTPEYKGGQLFSYFLLSRDMIQEDASRTKYEYNPWYGGIGARGYIVNSAYRYRGDFIYQGGSTYNLVLNGNSEAASISAAAVLVNFTWSLPVLPKIDPQLTADFATGSGDGDASRVTNGSQSNTAGTYTAFQNFGTFSGGLALKPRLANLQVYRVGTYLRPFKSNFALRNMSVQLKYSYYRKNVAAGGISDPGATEANSDVGHAGDVAFVYNWKADVQFFYGFGVFKPGDAYPAKAFDGTDAQAWRYAHLISLTLIF